MLPKRNSAQLLVERYRIGDDTSGLLATQNHFSGLTSILPKQVTDGSGSASLRDGDLARVIDELRFERYPKCRLYSGSVADLRSISLRLYYWLLRPLLGVSTRKYLQRLYLRGWRELSFPKWPVDTTVDDVFERLLILAMQANNLQCIPFIWFWPRGYSSCAIMTHDVETANGLEACDQLMDLDESFGIKASFQLVPEKRYPVSAAVVSGMLERGFEVNVQDLNHDGLLFSSYARFSERVSRINKYGRQFGAAGFRAAGLYRNPAWYEKLRFSYDMSIPNVAHLDPQRGGCCTVFPFFIGELVELPVTTTQDYSLFHILNHHSIDIWKQQLSIIRQKHGLMTFIIHPDYIGEERPLRLYTELLEHLSSPQPEATWMPLPHEVASWWRLRSNLRLVRQGASWKIQGEGSENATVAYAMLEKGKLVYTADQLSGCAIAPQECRQ